MTILRRERRGLSQYALDTGAKFINPDKVILGDGTEMTRVEWDNLSLAADNPGNAEIRDNFVRFPGNVIKFTRLATTPKAK